MGFKDLFIKSEEGNISSKSSDVSNILKDLPQSSTKSQFSSNPIQNNTCVGIENSIITEGIKTIDEIFENQDINNESIYDVIGFIESLPQSMDIVTKKNSLKSILKAAKHDIDTMITNSEERIEILSNYLDKDNITILSNIDSMNSNITIRLQEIETLKQDIVNEQNTLNQQRKLINDEINKINELKNYII